MEAALSQFKSLEDKLRDDATAFIEELAAETGVSEEFMRQAGPAIRILFTDVPEDQRVQCLETIRAIVQNQASIEKNIHQVKISTEMLYKSQVKMYEQLKYLSQKTQELDTVYKKSPFSFLQLRNRNRMIH